MWFNRMELEDWFDTYQYEVEYDVGESAVKYLTFDDLNVDLNHLPLRYGHHRGRPDLRGVIADQYQGLSAEEIIVTTGASEANFCAVAALVKPKDHVIIHHPNYPSLYEVPRSLGCQVDFIRLTHEKRFQLDIDELKRLLTPNTRVISLTYPNNPTGAMISEETLHAVIRLVESRNIFLLFDETYRELAYGKPLPWAASLSKNVISISSMSKSYGLPGIRTGWLACQSKQITDTVLAVREQLTITNGAISEEIAFWVLQEKKSYLKKAIDHVQQNFRIVKDWMAGQNDLEWIPPEAGVVALPRIRNASISDPEKLYRTLAEKHKTFVIPGRCFELDNQYFRLGYGGTTDELKIGLKHIMNTIREVEQETLNSEVESEN
jgi:aspartate/methionine/tyrosine aminotransferase